MDSSRGREGEGEGEGEGDAVVAAGQGVGRSEGFAADTCVPVEARFDPSRTVGGKKALARGHSSFAGDVGAV